MLSSSSKKKKVMDMLSLILIIGQELINNINK